MVGDGVFSAILSVLSEVCRVEEISLQTKRLVVPES